MSEPIIRPVRHECQGLSRKYEMGLLQILVKTRSEEYRQRMRELPASVGQRLLWLMDHYRGQHNSFNEQVLWHLREPCDVDALRVAVQRLHDRHESLRTTFV